MPDPVSPIAVTPIPSASRVTPEEFIAQLPAALRAESGTDTDLTAVLEEHIITATPNTDAALAVIIELAQTRATPVTAPAAPQEAQEEGVADA